LKPLLLRLKTDPLGLLYNPSNYRLFINGSELVPEIRRLKDLSDVVYDREFFSKADKEIPLYFMYRGLSRNRDKALCKSFRLRFDVTIIPPIMLGEEYAKTLGHCHPEAQKGLTYPELYEVLQGQADFLLQRWKRVQGAFFSGEIKDVMIVKAFEGERVLIPPNYGHIAINPSGKALVLANWVSDAFSSVYEPYKRRGGGAYFELSGGRLIPNPRYGHLPFARLIRADELRIPPLPKSGSIYEAFIRQPDCLEFLNKPELLRDLTDIL